MTLIKANLYVGENIKKPKSFQLIFGIFAFVALILFFQNCGQPRLNYQTFNAEKNVAVLPSTELTSGGNGEGYGGKLNGIYAKVDYANACAQNTVTELRIRDQIEIKNGAAFYTIRNCQPLMDQMALLLSEITTSSLNNQVFIMHDEIFQKAAWTASGIVPRESYVNVYCQGRDFNTLPNVQRIADLFVNDSQLASQFRETLLLSEQSTSFSYSFILSGILQISDIRTDENKILSTQNLNYNLQHTISGSSSSAAFENAMRFYDGQNPLSHIFSANYVSSSPINLLQPEQMNYFLNNSSNSPETITTPLCWKH